VPELVLRVVQDRQRIGRAAGRREVQRRLVHLEHLRREVAQLEVQARVPHVELGAGAVDQRQPVVAGELHGALDLPDDRAVQLGVGGPPAVRRVLAGPAHGEGVQPLHGLLHLPGGLGRPLQHRLREVGVLVASVRHEVEVLSREVDQGFAHLVAHRVHLVEGVIEHAQCRGRARGGGEVDAPGVDADRRAAEVGQFHGQPAARDRARFLCQSLAVEAHAAHDPVRLEGQPEVAILEVLPLVVVEAL